ncbi:hypothetical protein GQ54DRAFT_196978 [Martensiomyces pterosporus]|nr:hypothetical protein GQ54DRAFT_196978 [Martensiomyces pterosporus]
MWTTPATRAPYSVLEAYKRNRYLFSFSGPLHSHADALIYFLLLGVLMGRLSRKQCSCWRDARTRGILIKPFRVGEGDVGNSQRCTVL